MLAVSRLSLTKAHLVDECVVLTLIISYRHWRVCDAPLASLREFARTDIHPVEAATIREVSHTLVSFLAPKTVQANEHLMKVLGAPDALRQLLSIVQGYADVPYAIQDTVTLLSMIATSSLGASSRFIAAGGLSPTMAKALLRSTNPPGMIVDSLLIVSYAARLSKDSYSSIKTARVDEYMYDLLLHKVSIASLNYLACYAFLQDLHLKVHSTTVGIWSSCTHLQPTGQSMPPFSSILSFTYSE